MPFMPDSGARKSYPTRAEKIHIPTALLEGEQVLANSFGTDLGKQIRNAIVDHLEKHQDKIHEYIPVLEALKDLKNEER